MDSLREQFENLVEGVGAEQNWVREEGHILVSLAQGRQQRVALEYFDYEGIQMMRFHTRIGSTRRIRSERLAFALELNWQLPHGAMAVHADTLALVETMALSEANGEKIASVVAFLAEMADRYEKAIFGQDDY
ncbi:MAG: hypothetical protein P8M78_08465 [Myxococcota bacterium]|nr:hypothetical protein [Myxococcota bacterium]